MARVTRIHKGKQSHRFHYIPEWAHRRGVKQADIARELGVEKSTVGRWFKGSVPTNEHLIPLASYLNAGDPPEPAALFRHPDDDWLTRLMRGRDADELERLRIMVEAAFPPKVA